LLSALKWAPAFRFFRDTDVLSFGYATLDKFFNRNQLHEKIRP